MLQACMEARAGVVGATTSGTRDGTCPLTRYIITYHITNMLSCPTTPIAGRPLSYFFLYFPIF